MSYEFALLPVKQVKKPSFFSSLFSKKEGEKTKNNEFSDATQHRKQKVAIDYVSLFQSRPEQDGFAYYENNSKKPAFSASKDKVFVHILDDNAIRAGLQLAHTQFGEIKVDGPDNVRRQVWLQGQAIGIDVAGYEPNEKDQAAADKLRQSLADATATAQISAANEPVNSVPASPVASEPELEQKEEPVVRQPDEAGAEAGDQVSLERLGRDKVKVLDQKTNLFREVDRQTWRVNVLEKAAVVARQEAIAAARNVIGTDAPIYQAKINGGASEGSIIHINQHYVVQQVKMAAVIHDVTKLSGSASIGQQVRVQYNDGIGNVEIFEKTKEQFAQLFSQELEPDYEYERD